MRWRAAQARHQGRIQAGSIGRNVTFAAETDPGVNARIDEAYRAKYARYPQYVAPMLTAEVRAASLKLSPID